MKKENYIDLEYLKEIIDEEYMMDSFFPPPICKYEDLFRYISYRNFANEEITRFMYEQIKPRARLTIKEAKELAIEFTWRMSLAEKEHTKGDNFMFKIASEVGCNIQDLLSAME